jgi:P4 family phage/plasmid primase-like protien
MMSNATIDNEVSRKHLIISERKRALLKRGYHEDVVKLAEWLESTDTKSAIMQVDALDSKKPAYVHSKESTSDKGLPSWTSESFMNKPPSSDWGILLHDIVVVDCDTNEGSAFFMKEFPEDFNESTIHETTKKGMHWYFKRPNWLYGRDSIVDKVDIKTLARTGNRTLIICAPSTHKKWVVAPWEGQLHSMSHQLVKWLQERSNTIVSPNLSLHARIFGRKQSNSNISLTTLQRIIQNVNVKRASDYGSWRNGVWAIASAGADNKWAEHEILNMMDEFSKRSSKYVEGANNKFYDEALSKLHDVNIGTLWFWLKEDAFNVFQELQETSVNKLIDNAENSSDVDIALVIEKMIGEAYKCCINSNGKIEHYHFMEHRWKREPKWPSVWRLMNTTIASAFLKRSNYWNSKSLESLNEVETATYSIRSTKLKNVVLILKNHTKRGRIFAEFEKLCCVSIDEFSALFDSNKLLVGFNNGILDLETGTFRDGLPEDMVTFSTGYDWAFTCDEAIQTRINNFISSIMTNTDMVNYTLDRFAYLLGGIKKYQNMNLAFWVGSGANGKGCSKSLIMKAFGDYAYEADASLVVTRRTDSARATPELIKMKGRRAVFCSEPDSNLKINTSQLKVWTGGDKIQARALFGTADEFEAQFGLIVLMNNLPELNDIDGGFRRRIDVVDHVFKFVDIPMLPNEKLIDYDLDQLFKNNNAYAQQFMRIIAKRYQGLSGTFNRPVEVQQATDKYLEANDCVKKFILDKLVKTQNMNDFIKSSDMFKAFKISEVYNGRKQEWFNTQMESNGYSVTTKTTKGVAHMCKVFYYCKWIDENDSDEEK